MFKRKVRAQTCFLMGVVSGVLLLLASLLTMLGQGAATFLLYSAFAFQGAMVLFLATTESGTAHKTNRYKLLGLFLLVVLGMPNLPPVSGISSALVTPLLLLMYYTGPARMPVAFGLLALDIVYVGVDLIMQVNMAGQGGELALGQILPRYILLAVVGVARAAAAYLLFRQERDKRPDPGADVRPQY